MPPLSALRTVRRAQTEPKETNINLRVSRQTRELIDTAAAVVGKSRTDFMLESARQNAIDVLLDQRLFVLSEDQYLAFKKVLDNPPPPNAALKKLMASKAPWDR